MLRRLGFTTYAARVWMLDDKELRANDHFPNNARHKLIHAGSDYSISLPHSKDIGPRLPQEQPSTSLKSWGDGHLESLHGAGHDHFHFSSCHKVLDTQAQRSQQTLTLPFTDMLDKFRLWFDASALALLSMSPT